MSARSRYDKGDWKVVCDICGIEYKASQLQKRWDGFMVCSYDWEPRHPQDFVRGVADFQAPPYTRPESSDTFLADSALLLETGFYLLQENGSRILITMDAP